MEPMELYTELSEPRNLRLKDFQPHDKHATVVWETVRERVDKFYVKCWKDGEEEESEPKALNVPAFTLNNIQPGMRYNIQVACMTLRGGRIETSAYSEVFSFKTAPKPLSRLRVRPGLESPSTSFLIEYDDDEPVDKKYQLSITNLVNGRTKEIKSKQLFATVEDLTPGASYMVSITCTKNGVQSKPCKLDAPIQTHPEKVTDLKIERSSVSTQTVSWAPVFGADSYNVKWRRKDGNFKSVPTKDTQITLSNLDSGQVFEVCVAAVNRNGTGEYSETKEFNTDLAPPVNLKAVLINSGEEISAEITFTAVVQQEIAEYIVELHSERRGQEDEEHEPVVQHASTTHAVFTQLEPSTCYVPSVFAVAENGVRSKKVFGNTFWTKPGQVRDFHNYTISGNSEKITWEAVKGATSYNISSQEDGKQPVAKEGIKETEITLWNLALNTKFSISVAAKNQGGVGRYSTPVTFHTALAAPSSITVSNLPVYPECGILAKWDPCDGTSRYNVEIVDAHTNDKNGPFPVNNKCSHQFLTNVQPGHEYKVGVQAIAADDDKRNSAIEYSETIWTYCDHAREVTAKLVSPSIAKITWNKSTGAQEYKVICKASDGKEIEERAESNQFTLTHLELGKSYQVAVSPKNHAGYGKESVSETFRTGLAPAANVQLFNISMDSVKIKFTEPKNKPPAYNVQVVSTSDDDDPHSKIIRRDHCVLSGLNPGTDYVAYVWSTDPDDTDLDSVRVGSRHFVTAPPAVKGLDVHKDSPTSRHITWKAAPGATSYNVKVKKAGAASKCMPSTTRNEYQLDNLDLHSKYSVTVTAQNESGEGEESRENRFETELHPPKKISVSNDAANPTTSLIVQVDEPDLPPSRYQLRIISLNGRQDRIIGMTRQEAMSVKTIDGLSPGDSFQLAICSLHDTDKSLNSKEVLSSVIQTKMPALTVKTSKISNNTQKIVWTPALEATGYKVMWRIEHGTWQSRDFEPHETETLLENLEPGRLHEVKVMASNRAGKGQESHPLTFTTAPATPEELKMDVISTRCIRVSCKESVGASGYIFNINGENHETNEPHYILQHGDLYTNFRIQVSTKNDGGCSPSSTVLNCKQTLLYLQDKFLKEARNNLREMGFIPPVITEVPSNKVATDFGTNDFSIGKGMTVCILATDSAGKTTCCSHYLQSLSEDKLGILLDWDDYKHLDQNDLDIKSVLSKHMRDFDDSEKDSTFQWIKEHSDQVVFTVDNLALPPSVAGNHKRCEDVGTLPEIFYSLVTTNREIFANSQVLCATTQNDMKQIIKPARMLKIVGFEKDQVEAVKNAILEENGEIPMPDHLKYFGINPWYCERVFRFLKHHVANVDAESYGSILIHLLSESVGRYPDGKKKEKLQRLIQEIRNVPQRLRTTKVDLTKTPKKPKLKSESSATSVAFSKQETSSQISDAPSFIEMQSDMGHLKHSCENLHDHIIKALYFGLFCSFEEFKQRFHKTSIKLGINGKIWILATGLLRKETTNLAAELFKNVDVELNFGGIRKKLDFAKTFAKTNFQRIRDQVSEDPQISLDWLDILYEIKDMDSNSDWKISVKNTHSPHEIEQMSFFFLRLRKISFDYTRVKFEKNIEAGKRLSIETAMRQNPYGEVSTTDSDSGIFSRNISSKSSNGKSLVHKITENIIGDAVDSPDVSHSGFSETCFTVKLQQRPGQRRHDRLLYVAKSQSTGKVLTVETNNDIAVFERIEPGDKYSVSVYEEAENVYNLLLAKSEIQTMKLIDTKGGKIVIGRCTINFPCGAVKTTTLVAVSACTSEIPPIPAHLLSIMPPVHLMSSQKKFSSQVKCKFHLPYITFHEEVKVEVLSFENKEWQKVCSINLTQNNTVEFNCSYFTPYAVALPMKNLVPRSPPFKMRMKNLVFTNKYGNFVGVTCLDDQWVINSCETELSDTYRRSQFEIESFDMSVNTVARYELKCIKPEQKIGQWHVTFDKKFTQTWMEKMQMRLSSDEGLLYEIPLITLALTREYGTIAAEWEVNERNPFKAGEAHQGLPGLNQNNDLDCYQ